MTYRAENRIVSTFSASSFRYIMNKKFPLLFLKSRKFQSDIKQEKNKTNGFKLKLKSTFESESLFAWIIIQKKLCHRRLKSKIFLLYYAFSIFSTHQHNWKHLLTKENGKKYIKICFGLLPLKCSSNGKDKNHVELFFSHKFRRHP